jgi:hypothetical protein
MMRFNLFRVRPLRALCCFFFLSHFTFPAPPQPAAQPAAASNNTFLHNTAPWLSGYLYSVVPQSPLGPIPDNGEKWFAVTRGKYVGLTKNSAISLNGVTGISTALSERFNTQAEALSHFNAALGINAVAVL